MAIHNDPLTAARYPDDNEPPSIATFIQNGVNDLSPLTIPTFSSTAARDTAYANWVAAGHAMRNGLMCTVGGQLYLYAASAWSGVSPHRMSGSSTQRWDGSTWRPVVASGTGSISVTAGQSLPTAASVSYGVTFSTAPAVVVSGLNSGTEYQWAFWALTTTTTGFVCQARWTSTGGAPTTAPMTFQWIAFGT